MHNKVHWIPSEINFLLCFGLTIGQCPTGRVFQYRVGSGRVLEKILGSGSGSGWVGLLKIRSGIFGYLFYSRVIPGIPGIFG